MVHDIYSRNPYINLEEILKYINRNFVTVDDVSIKAVNHILMRVLETIITKMRSLSALFNRLYEAPLYGGSFYDGLKVGQPDEFDIDLKLFLPKILNAQVIPISEPGFVFVQLRDWDRFIKDSGLYSLYKDLENLKDSSNYLLQEKVLLWIQQLVDKAIHKIKQEKLLPDVTITRRIGISGPAVTLHIECNNRKLDIDLVAVFRMSGNKWPEYPFRSDRININDFMLVPKAPKTNVSNQGRHWRLSFQQQEQRLINGYYFCKPALRLLKKLRDTRDHNIPSYFIKTVFLWHLEQTDGSFWNTSLNTVFIQMLFTYKKYLDDGTIPYYWNRNNNLLQYTKPDTICNIRNFLNKMINKIDTNIEKDPFIIAKFLLPKHEYDQVFDRFNNIELESARIDDRFNASKRARIDEQLYAEFEKEFKQTENRSMKGKNSTFLRFLACVAIFTAIMFFTRSTP